MSHDHRATADPDPDDATRPDHVPGSDAGTSEESREPALGASPASAPSSHDEPSGEPRSGWIPTAPAADTYPKRDRTRARSSNRPLLLAVAGGIIGVSLLIWLLVSLFGESEETNLVDPSSLSPGECLSGFTAITEDATFVDCAEVHNAQLLASESYAEDAEFPGRDQLGARAEAACDDASDSIDPDNVPDDLDITLLRATPTEATWADGDRRVDCFAVIENGDTMSQSLLSP